MDEPFVAVPVLQAARTDAEAGGDGVDDGEPGHGRHRFVEGEHGPPLVPVDRGALGPLAPFATDEVSDLLVNGAAGLWIDAGRGLRRDDEWELGEREVRDLAVRLVASGGRHVDEAHPCVDVRLGGGIRVHVALPPISTTGTLISVRIPRGDHVDLASLRRTGMIDAAQERELVAVVRRRENVLITGAAGVGKTTLLAALLSSAPPHERIVVVEDVAELRVRHQHVVGLEARQANVEGAGHVGLDSLVREALRMRPDRLILGECRGAELRELLTALNTGHDGGAGTLHANSLADVPARIEALGALAGMDDRAVARQTVSAIGLVLHLERSDGVRRLAQLGRFATAADGRLTIAAVG
nr:TadA family conjugal transfer-associated ATPase [Leifsonia sp. Leaf325]